MIVYVTYLLTMEDSPEVSQISVTASSAMAGFHLRELQEYEFEDEESGDWAKACVEVYDVGDARIFDPQTAVIVVKWTESVKAMVIPFANDEDALSYIKSEKARLMAEDECLVPFDGDEMHLCNDGLMSDYYFGIEHVTII